MITIFSGEYNSGKTTALLENYQKNLKGAGFLSVKTLEEGHVKGYDALELSTGKRMRLAYHESFRPKTFNNSLKLGPYSFDEKVFRHIEERILSYRLGRITPIYLDEIGVLELTGWGYARLLRSLVENKVDTVLGIRSDLVPKVVEAFQIKEYRHIAVHRNEEVGCSILG